MIHQEAVQEVLAQYPAGIAERVEFLGNRGGFSGARLWRTEGLAGTFCLRAWPETSITPHSLTTIHQHMKRGRRMGLAYVPSVLPTRKDDTFVEHAGRLWEITTWMPGRADFAENPTPARLAAACTALARLHRAWVQKPLAFGPCPAVLRRWHTTREWLVLVAAGWQPRFDTGPADPVRPWAERAWKIVTARIGGIPDLLRPWGARPVLLQPCLCDIWHDHILFSGETVTGLIDYGSVKRDHVAVDLARLLGSLAGEDRELRQAGLTAYQGSRPLTDQEQQLIEMLDISGTLLGAVNWLRWLYHEGRRYEDSQAVAQRLAAIVIRLEA